MKCKQPPTTELDLIKTDVYHVGGVLWRRKRDGYNRRIADRPAGYRNRDYLYVQVGKTSYAAHRIVWFLENGQWPDMHIDHIDGNKLNNHPSNLRLCTPTANMQNCKTVNSISGHRGVSWSKKSKKWMVRITVNKKRLGLGYFDDAEFAGLVYTEAHARLFPEVPPYAKEGVKEYACG